MERLLSLALLLALILTTVCSPAVAESDEILTGDTALAESDILPSGDFELDEADILDNDLPIDLEAQIDLQPDPEAATDVQPDDGEGEPPQAGILSNGESKPRLSESSITIGVEEQYTKLVVLTNASNDSSPKIKWRSANKKIAKVNSKTGKITGVKKGKTTIYAKVEGYSKEIKCKVNVLKAPKKKNFSISPKNGSLKVGQVGQYTLKFDSGYGGGFTFSSSDPSIAEIDENGLVTAISPGTCEITATLYNEVERTVSLQVLKNGSSENKKIEKVLKCARKKLGKPYKHGKKGPNEFDCVGFTYWCYKQVDVKLKSSTKSQAHDTRWMEVSYDEIAPGDLMYFSSDDSSTVSHAALYLGDGEIIHASESKGKVLISELTNYYERNFYCALRVFS